MNDILDLSLVALRDAVAARQISAVEAVSAYIDAQQAARALNCYLVETPDLALKQAHLVDESVARGEAGPLAGVPLGIKDLFCTKGVATTAASRILEGFVPTYESTVTDNLRRAGAVMLGKLNMDQFAMGSSNETSAYGNVISPWRDDTGAALTPGGSSGGSSAAVAARLCVAATGSDTGGSIRQPAAFTGIVGVKPTYGRCSRWGMVAFASSLDQAGPMGRNIADCALMLGSMVSYDPKDSTSIDAPVPDYLGGLVPDMRGLKIGIPKEYRVDGMPADIDRLWQQGADWLRAAGAEVVEVSLPHTSYALPTYYIIAPAEASSNLARYDGVRYGQRVLPKDGSLAQMYAATRAAGFGPEVQRRILIGTYVLSAGYYDAYYLKAQQVRALIAQDFTQAFEQCDLILTPTAPSAAFPLGAKVADPLAMYLNDVFTVPASLAGLPALSVPAGLSAQGLPLGLHLIGKPMAEQTLLNAGLALEQAAAFTARPARWW